MRFIEAKKGLRVSGLVKRRPNEEPYMLLITKEVRGEKKLVTFAVLLRNQVSPITFPLLPIHFKRPEASLQF